MNECDLFRLIKLNERYGSTNLTAFRIVDRTTSRETVLGHIRTDLRIMNSSDVEYKHAFRVILAKGHIDICTVDNGTPVTYLFTEDAEFAPQSIVPELSKMCCNFDVDFENRSELIE